MNKIRIADDTAQRRDALNPAKSFIVQAPAGSGKTELLIQRFLTLLGNVSAPEEIIAITFTKKAANEMRSRVVNALNAAKNKVPVDSPHAQLTRDISLSVLEQDRKHHWNLLDNPNRLRIQTIDSLCSTLTRQLPLLSHLGAQVNLTESPDEIYEEAVYEVLSHLESDQPWSDSIKQLFIHLDNDFQRIHNLLVQLLKKRDQWLAYVHTGSDNLSLRAYLESQLAQVVDEAYSDTRSFFPAVHAAEIIAIARYAGNQLITQKSESATTSCVNLVDLPGHGEDIHTQWQGLIDLLLTKEGEWRKKVDIRNGFPAATAFKNKDEKFMATEYKDRMLNLLKTLSDHDQLRSMLHDLRFLPPRQYDESQWSVLQSLFDVLKVCAAQLRIQFQKNRKIDFIENTQAALLALGSDDMPTDLALALDYQIKHILIDEFQDTSYTQFRLLEKLTLGWEANDGRTLFVVGDPMQSIYRFREAEVGLFLRLWESGINHIHLNRITLYLNFRSSPTVIDWNNHHFKNIFPLESHIASGAVCYKESASNKLDDNNSITEVFSLSNEPHNEQAIKIVQIVNSIMAENPDSTIAILVRARSHLQSIIPELKNANIPYRAIEIDTLANRQYIHDALSLTIALLYPEDKIAWLSVLRAPWCGLTLSDLHIIAGEDQFSTIWDRLTDKDVMEKLSADGCERINRILPILDNSIKNRFRFTYRTWVDKTWRAIGGPACLQNTDEVTDTLTFFSLLDEFNDSAGILNVVKLKQKIHSLYANSSGSNQGLQLMTIHSAKGLEFDSVIVPYLEKKPASDSNQLMHWMEHPLKNGNNALLLAPIHAVGDDTDPIYQYISRQQKKKLDNEISRLLYVAFTRAKKNLFMLYAPTVKSDHEKKAPPGSFLDKLWAQFANLEVAINTRSENSDTSPHPPNTNIRFMKRLTKHWHNPISSYSCSTDSSVNIGEQHRKRTAFTMPSNYHQLLGTITHRILYHLSQQGLNWWSLRDTADQVYYIEQQYRQINMSPDQIDAATKATMQMINNAINDDRGQWILANHNQAESEFAITTHTDGKLTALVIDRTFIDDNGNRWIIDYKSSTLSDDDLDKFLATEANKYREKMQAYGNAMRLSDERPVKLGLYFPALPAWREWDL